MGKRVNCKRIANLYCTKGSLAFYHSQEIFQLIFPFFSRAIGNCSRAFGACKKFISLERMNTIGFTKHALKAAE
jgi:hypothetical protein